MALARCIISEQEIFFFLYQIFILWGEGERARDAVLEGRGAEEQDVSVRRRGPLNPGRPIQRAMHRGGREQYRAWVSTSSSSSGDGCSHFEETKRVQGPKGVHWGGKMRSYRSQLEKEIQMLEKQLQEEIDLHVSLAKAAGNNFRPLPISPSNLQVKAQELLASIAVLEKTVRKLEEELFVLHFRLQHERKERHAVERHLKYLQISLPEPPASTSGNMLQECVRQVSPPLHLDVLRGCEDLVSFTATAENSPSNEVFGQFSGGEDKKQIDFSLQPLITELKVSKVKKLWQHPNELSEEMVLCMKNIFLCLSGSPTNTSKASSSDDISSPTSPEGDLSLSSLMSFSDSFRVPSTVQSFSEENCEIMDQGNLYDPYGVNERFRYIGKYSLATEVSWMSVGKAQLDFAAEALKNFRFLVDQLAKVNPAKMSSDEKLAFWINLYNALIMHAYLAYGVPKSEIKLFSLMQKACYTVGDQSFSAADIEFGILKMKPPAHRPQIALVLALHKFKMSEEHRTYSIDCSKPLALFALSCGMYSCPAVRIFTADSVQDELQKSMEDYIQASIGISKRGKLLVPKLLYCFAKELVDDSLLVDWICTYLTPEQAAIVGASASQRKQRLLDVRNFSIIPFNSRFRYLFLPCNKSHKCPA